MMSKGTGGVGELCVIATLFTGAIACTLSSISSLPYDLIEFRFCPVSVNGKSSKSQKNLDETYCSHPRFVLREYWDNRGLYGSQIPERDDIKFKRKLSSDNPYQHLLLTGTALCLAGISMTIATRNNILQQRYYQWLEDIKTAGFTLWTEHKQERSLLELNGQLNAQLKADIAVALDNQTRIEAGLINTEVLSKQQNIQFELQDKSHAMQLAAIDKQIETDLNDAQKQRHERLKRSHTNNSDATTENNTQKLIKRLQEHENGWLYDICTGIKPLYIIGDQGSFKSYTAAAIALARQYLNGWKLVSIIDPHLHQNQNLAWKLLLKLEPELFGALQNWEEVNRGIADALGRWGRRSLDDEPISSIFDEMTNYSLHDECKEAAVELNRRVLSDPRKSNEGVIIISHGFTNEAIGGTKGFSKTRQSGTLQLELKSDNKMRPLFKGILNGYKDESGNLIEDMPITLPEWFKPEIIYEEFRSQKSL